eukprot:Clim_evm17s220 gene=Clim_evmTU17s220
MSGSGYYNSQRSNRFNATRSLFQNRRGYHRFDEGPSAGSDGYETVGNEGGLQRGMSGDGHDMDHYDDDMDPRMSGANTPGIGDQGDNPSILLSSEAQMDEALGTSGSEMFSGKGRNHRGCFWLRCFGRSRLSLTSARVINANGRAAHGGRKKSATGVEDGGFLVDAPQRRPDYPSNGINNTKYSVFTFLPKVLWEQFRYFLNFYFLVICLSQFIPALRIGYLYTYWGPLAFVISVTMAKEIYDDILRFQRDRRINREEFTQLTPDGSVPLRSEDVRVGQLLVLQKDQRVPADCVLLRTSDASGACFIRTDQLDGETDWKIRLACPVTQSLRNDMEVLRLRDTVVEAEPPNQNIHSFVGRMLRNKGYAKGPSSSGDTVGGSASFAAPLRNGSHHHSRHGTQSRASHERGSIGHHEDQFLVDDEDFVGDHGDHGSMHEYPGHGVEMQSFSTASHGQQRTETQLKRSNISTSTSGSQGQGGMMIHRQSSTAAEEHGPNAPSEDPLSIENTLWANTVLSAGTAIGLVIYTGPETRAAMNNSSVPSKFGRFDTQVNDLSKILFVFTLLMALMMVILRGFYGVWYIVLFRFVLLFSQIIPISLRVNLDMAKIVHSYFIMKDDEIPNTVVRNSNLPEELGRVQYLLTDKTGTLTRNEMIFRKFHIGLTSYDSEAFDDVSVVLKEELERRQSELAQQGQQSLPRHQQQRQQHDYSDNGDKNKTTQAVGNLLGSLDSVDAIVTTTTPAAPVQTSSTTIKPTRRANLQAPYVTDAIVAMALCHNVTPVDTITGVSYQASSPDEIALVEFAEGVGLRLHYRDLTSMTLELGSGSVTDEQFSIPGVTSLKKVNNGTMNTKSGQQYHYQILDTFPFSSERKRMGIIVRDEQTDRIFFYMKGADSVMAQIVTANDWLAEEADNMAREGLRTLVFGRSELSKERYRSFAASMKSARAAMVDRNVKISDAIAEIESDLQLLALTGVEDRLQEDVKQTIELIRNAGIRIWMLTGDKVETATNIAQSSRLIDRKSPFHTIQGLTTAAEAHAALNEYARKTGAPLIIDGQSLAICLSGRLQEDFIALASQAATVVACRCSPTQKAEVTTLVKSYTHKIAAAIGDGGNDVSMIQAADVGIGMVGKEGMQASLASDFSIGSFRYLARLLLWHGHNAYRRSASLSQFVIHRGLIISVIQAIFSATFYYAAVPIYQGALLVGYATVYTMMPVFSLVLDEDMNAEQALLFPELYKDLVKGRSLSLKTFLGWFLVSVYQGSAIMLGALFLFESEMLHIVSITFTSLILTELIVVALRVHRWHWTMILAELLSLVIYMISIVFLPTYFDLDFIKTGEFWWKVVVITAISVTPLWIIKVVKNRIDPPAYIKIQ